MAPDWKKIALISGFIILTLFLGWLIYFTFFRLTPSLTDNNGNINGNTGLPQASQGNSSINSNYPGSLPGAAGGNVNVALDRQAQSKLPADIASGGLTKTQKLIDLSAVGLTLTADGNGLLYYDSESGKFYRISNEGKKTEISSKIFYLAENVVWSNNKDEAIIEYPDSSKILYNFETETQVTLPKHWQEFDFSSDDKQMVVKSLGNDPDNRFLIVSKPDGSSARTINALGTNADIVSPDWAPNNQIIATYVKGIDGTRQELFFMGLNDENYKSIVIAGRGFSGQWSPHGEKILYSVYNSQTGNIPVLYVVDALGNKVGLNQKNLKVMTWSNKCVFENEENVYCAVPTNLDEGAGFSQEMMDKYPDIIYKINLVTGYKTVLAVPDENFTINKIMISNSGKYLYFQDKFSGKVYKINLR